MGITKEELALAAT